MEILYKYSYSTPFGNAVITTSDKGLAGLSFFPDETTNEEKDTDMHKEVYRQLNEYFNQKRTKFDIPLDLRGTKFQNRAWTELYNIPYGKLITYKQLAEKVGSPKAYRAVGLANNRNPIAIICACHRVIGSNGKLVGYAYGLDMKEDLIKLESAVI